MAQHSFGFFVNPAAATRATFPFQAHLPASGAAAALADILRCPRYAPTPLLTLSGGARRAGVASVSYKDESGRFGLKSFKALGGAYAVAKHLEGELERELGRKITIEEIADGKHRDLTARVTVACASDGNHGRAVAAGARLFHCKCVIYLHEGVSPGRVAAVEGLGATVVRTTGNYDNSVLLAKAAAAKLGWKLISDTACYDEDLETPKLIMQGYRVLINEALQQIAQLGLPLPTHIFLQGGVGGLAAAVIAHIHEAIPDRIPTVIVVEPERADCLFKSATHGHPTPVVGELDTVMAGLACGQVSMAAWPILAAGTDIFMTIPDQMAIETMRQLANGSMADDLIVAGESGVAGLAGLMTLSKTGAESYRMRAGLGPQSHVLVIGTEGATDPTLYQQIVGTRLAERAIAGAK
jgi:diaminopropionate ammonia-lyase